MCSRDRLAPIIGTRDPNLVRVSRLRPGAMLRVDVLRERIVRAMFEADRSFAR